MHGTNDIRIITLDLKFLGFNGAIAAYLIPHASGAVLVECGPGSTLEALEAGLALLKSSPPRCQGTSALRGCFTDDARTREEFLRLVADATGFTVEVLSGEDEALWTYRGAISGIPGVAAATVMTSGAGVPRSQSGTAAFRERKPAYNVGSVRLTERYFHHDPPLPREIDEAREAVRRELAKTGDFPFGGSTPVAVARTATTLSLLSQGLKEFDIHAVTNVRIPYSTVEHLYNTLSLMPSAMIRELSEVLEGRADVITAGALILRDVMQLLSHKV